MPSDPDDIPETTFRLMALEAILIDMLATGIQQRANPEAFAKAYRERMRNILTVSIVPVEGANQEYQAYIQGEVADAVDRLIEKVQPSLARRIHGKKSSGK